MSRKINIIIVALAIGLVVLGGIGYMALKSSESIANTTSLHILDISVKDDSVQIIGSTIDSALAFDSYKYSIKHNNLYVSLLYGLVSENRQSGDFDITIKEDTSNIQKVYLKGKNKEDLKLIWSK